MPLGRAAGQRAWEILMNGLLYTATGRRYVEQALVSIESARRWNPGIPVAVFTDDPGAFADWADHVTPFSPPQTRREQMMLPRLQCLARSPFVRTLALDTDTVIMGPIHEVFDVLDATSVGICHGHQRTVRFTAALRDGKAMAEIPYAFGPVQGGVILFDDGDGRRFVEDVASLYQDKQYEDDQVSMREVLWRANYRFATLPPEYNIYDLDELTHWDAEGFKVALPKIFHTVSVKQFLGPGEIDDLLLPVARRAAAAADRWAAPVSEPTDGKQGPVGTSVRRARVAVGRLRRRRSLLREIRRNSSE